jgi:glyoxylase-like metal-dependent hydrolase (beta-lactamase superfamily II)
MRVHAITTGTVRITRSWQRGHGPYALRLARTLFDPRLTEPLPIWCWLIEHPEGLILIDTGIPHNANRPVWFPPHMRLAQRAAPFQISDAAQEIGPQVAALGYSPATVRWVILTHLHQDHEGGLHHFPQAEFFVARAEWQAAAGLAGRMGGYLNTRWPKTFAPTRIDFSEKDTIFGGRHTLTAAGDVILVPTPGHSAGHLSVIVQHQGMALFFAGDASYSEALLLEDALDGVTQNARVARETHRRILQFAAQQPTVFLPSHEWAARDRLEGRTPIAQR